MYYNNLKKQQMIIINLWKYQLKMQKYLNYKNNMDKL